MINHVPLLFLIISKFGVIAQEGLSSRPYVETDKGSLLGNTSLSRDGHQYFQFLGIPYGIVPERFGVSRKVLLGKIELFFKFIFIQSSRPALPWNTPRNALDYGPACSQINEFTGEISGQEDCLYLNVYTPMVGFPLVHYLDANNHQ